MSSPSAASPGPSASAPAGGKAATDGPRPDEDRSLAGAFLLTLSGLLISASAAFGLRRTARH
ncbi:hypothetical protein [Arthrobacter sp. PM3]|uniref:hypothetical protein n=1 Tax=Arthrobacter sp. PM3 TaxID=2017685 RepID=UPI000E10604A|nr:hypothetical protein [Arthrobacter sp. PM3]AXJ11296.1 hypothetical protein CFN17_18055 [Arthrobacter sp. PM3]